MELAPDQVLQYSVENRIVQQSINGHKPQLDQNIPIVTEQNEGGLERTSYLDRGVWQLIFSIPKADARKWGPEYILSKNMYFEAI